AMRSHSTLTLVFFLFSILLLSMALSALLPVYAQEEFRQREFVEEGKPRLVDPHLKVEQVTEGLDTPTTMAFLGPNDILVLEKDKGTVQRIVNGKISDQPLLDVSVANSVERCLCGIAVSKHNSTTYVFLYYTEINGKDGEDRQGKEPIANRLYRYELVDNKLVNPAILLDLPATPGPRHNGGSIIIGPDNNLYVPIGDIDGSFRGPDSQTVTQNYQDGKDPDGRSGILRITQDGQPAGEGILGNSIPLSLYYAYGIRNSFGLGFDPVTGNLWDTENGPGNSDEINLVQPGFNSGWQEVMGLANDEDGFDQSDLVNFDGKGVYRDPELVWLNTAGPTAILFLTSDKLGPQYLNDMFVADVHNGRIYHFDLTSDRTHLVLPPPLAGKVIKNPRANGLDQIMFGEEFGGITDLKVGPDGYLYVVSVGLGKIFRILPT
ncbi:MAG TPA: PQQ-dependent sugar dehydrogenase, partial [Nitrososphaeraceae archaeon]|nr:PQQ-dependent sugar dehydrogenase [Nitrososphaeraceae archaeon]